jgi:hypothetical protein
MREDVFPYSPNNDPLTVEWYVNFADTQLFVAYGGSLFAQVTIIMFLCYMDVNVIQYKELKILMLSLG